MLVNQGVKPEEGDLALSAVPCKEDNPEECAPGGLSSCLCLWATTLLRPIAQAPGPQHCSYWGSPGTWGNTHSCSIAVTACSVVVTAA